MGNQRREEPLAETEQPATPRLTMRAHRERSIRWQSNAMQQLGQANNLILAFAVATIAFEFKLLLDQPTTALCGLLFGFGASILFLGLSFLLGLYVVFNRLEDFRESAHAARALEDGDKAKHANHSEKAKKLGPKTWCVFRTQLWSFGLGLLVGVITLTVLVLRRF